jgi:glycosyltransferase involved in cell wall biosynthesis
VKLSTKLLGVNVIIDGIVYGFQKYGGINTYFNEVLPRIAARPNTRVRVLLPRRAKGAPPPPPVRVVPREVIPYQTRLSRRLDRKLEATVQAMSLRWYGMMAERKPRTVFQSSYFTVLPASIPQVGIVHDMNHELFAEKYDATSFGRRLREAYPRYLRHADRIIAISHVTKSHVVRFYGIDESLIDVVHHATDPRQFFVERNDESLARVRALLQRPLPFLLYVGGRWPLYKNFDMLLRAMARCARTTGLALVVAGTPWDDDEVSLLKSLGLEPHVQLVENPDVDLLRSLYNLATALVFPSHHEGFGIPLLEAMACGTLAIASDIDVFHEVAGDAAIYFAPSDLDALVRAIEASLDETVRQTYEQRGFARVAKYSWDRCAAETYAVYEKALAVSKE